MSILKGLRKPLGPTIFRRFLQKVSSGFCSSPVKIFPKIKSADIPLSQLGGGGGVPICTPLININFWMSLIFSVYWRSGTFVYFLQISAQATFFSNVYCWFLLRCQFLQDSKCNHDRPAEQVYCRRETGQDDSWNWADRIVWSKHDSRDSTAGPG